MQRLIFCFGACAIAWGCGAEGVVGTGDDPAVSAGDLDVEELIAPDESLLAAPHGDISAEEAAGTAFEQGDATRQMAASWSACSGVCGNCVYYARCRQPKLPGGLNTYADKKRIINRSLPRVGCVAVIKTSHVWGHVAYVGMVDGAKIRIAEANWARSCPSRRTGTKAGLNITGFFCP